MWALVRSPEKAAMIQKPGVEIIKGDLEHPETLDAALKGIDKVFLLSPDDPHQVELQGNLIEAAKRGSVRYIVKLSAFSAAPDSPVAFSRWHWQTEQHSSPIGRGTKLTTIRPGTCSKIRLHSIVKASRCSHQDGKEKQYRYIKDTLPCRWPDRIQPLRITYKK